MAHQVSSEAVCQLIDALLPRGQPVIEEVARLLRLSPRTLQRLLNGEGISYSDLVDRCRCKAACEALEKTPRSIQDIAARLGYADPSSFARAFRPARDLKTRNRPDRGQCFAAKTEVANVEKVVFARAIWNHINHNILVYQNRTYIFD